MSKTHTSRRTYEEALQRAIPGAVLHLAMAQTVVDVPCNGCGKLVEGAFHCANKMPPDKIAKVLRTRGWFIGTRANKHTCPRNDHPVPETITFDDLQEMVEVVEVEIPAAGAAASDKAKMARRDTVLLLAEVFDVETGRFKTGESDASVAAVTGLSEKSVADLRVEFYGPLKMPTEIEGLFTELGSIRQEDQRIAAEFTEKMAANAARYDAVERRINVLVQKNGWKDA